MCPAARSRDSRASTRPGPFTTQPITATFISSTPRTRLPDRHLLAQIRLNLIRHVLKERAGGAAAAGARRDLRSEAADAERLQNLLTHHHFFRAVAVRQRGERRADGIADTFLKQDRSAAVVATMPFAPSPASVSPRCTDNRSAQPRRGRRPSNPGRADLGAEDDPVFRSPYCSAARPTDRAGDNGVERHVRASSARPAGCSRPSCA